jgi:type IV pilus assembly protein PilY1
MDTMALFRRRFFQATVAAAALAAPVAHPAPPLTISTEPLATSAVSITPNVMLILDDSGSMLRDHMPDYVVDDGSSAACADHGDDNGADGRINDTFEGCVFGDPPYNSPDLNGIYYNPAIWYRPGANADGTEKTSMTAASTANWTKVLTDPYLSFATTNLATGFPDRVWCTAQADAATSGTCRQNSAYAFPNAQFPFGRTSGGAAVKTVNGAPYYYRMQTAQYCQPSNMSNCASGSAINPAIHTQLAPEFCTDPELKNCAAGNNVTPAHTHFGVRWCSDQTGLSNCQRKKLAPFIYAKHLGRVQSINCTANPALCAAVPNEGNIAVTSVHANGGSVDISIAGVPIIGAPVAFLGGTTTSTLAGLIVNAINSHVSSPDYTAVQSGANVLVTKVVPGVTGTGAVINVTPSSINTAQSVGSFVVSATSASGSSQTLTTLTINGTNLLCAPGVAISFGNSVTVQADGRIVAAGGTNAIAERDSMRAAVISRVNTCAANIAPGYSVTASDVSASSTVMLTAPLAMGSLPNGHVVARAGSGTITNWTTTNMAGGVTVQSMTATVQNMAGGRDAVTGTIDRRIGVGSFSRTDIVPANNSYPKAPGRKDCVGTQCTYAEEMTNFSNWYAYYRTRILMSKTSVGRAFVPINETYRVGFITICPVNGPNSGGGCDDSSTSGLSVVPAKYLKIANFDATHKAAWYSKLYSQNLSSSSLTPLREALSRVGRMYAGVFGNRLTAGLTAADEPLIASCQPNFAILATDGYWNGAPGQKTDGTSIGNQDNNPKDPFSTREWGAFDGALSGATNTLADVAMYYYKTDLRASGPFATNNVKPSTRDQAIHQHMVTFTIGLGLDGERSYQPNYEEAKSGDFFDIKQGTLNWPVPAENAPSTLDDLWHAAVNGRGLFFSAKNPTELAKGLTDTLSQLQESDGAGAAAATSNLQPVSGDNFAFIASYHIPDWYGQLEARTIDLQTLKVSSNDLWGARELLDQKPWNDRVIYTFDPTDTDNQNKLKSFCWPGDGGAQCKDGAGLDTEEQKYFDPSTMLSHYGSYTDEQKATVTAQFLVDYLRGDTSNEDTGTLGKQDLFRKRESKLGDLVNAQPSYVKKATFNYKDKGYAEFKACTAGTGGSSCHPAQFPNPSLPRLGTVYAAGNDGMLHAFETDVNNDPYFQTAGFATDAEGDDVFNNGNNTGNGVERWAYVPKLVMPNMHHLAEIPYIHHYFADGSPRAFDICISTPCAGQDDWRTILVAGLNRGGMGYFALDVTNPSAPKAMWEIGVGKTCYSDAEIAKQDKTSDCHIGYSYGLPIATKLSSDGRWVVLVTSGYNNADNGGDGRGYLYILDAVTGVILHRITTGSGTAASPSGLGKISAWADDASTDNTALAAYGGDLDGNLWRFQLDASRPDYLTATLVATLKDKDGNPQPITVIPELTTVNFHRVIVLGTGKFLELTDRAAPFSTQTIYGLRDDLKVTGGPVIKDVRDPADVKVRVFGPGAVEDERTIEPGDAPDWNTQHGWLVDLPDSGERVNIDPIVQLGLVSVPSNVPTSDTCSAGGYAWFNFIDVATGGVVPAPGNTMASKKHGNALLVGQSFICGPGDNCGVVAIDNKGNPNTQAPPIPPQGFGGRRVSWRELVVDQ